MKKFFSLLLTAAMMISTASVAFAADCSYSLTPATATVSAKNGDVIEFTLKLDTNPGIAGFINIMEFDASAFENEVYIHQVIEDDEVVEELELDAYSSWGDLVVNTGIEGQTIFQYAGAKNKTGKTVLKVNYKVKETAANGDYTFKLYAEEAMNADGKLVDVAETIATITVVDGASSGEDEPEVPADVTMDETAYSKDAAYNPNGEKTFGFKGTMNKAARYVNLAFEGAEVNVVLDFGETMIDATKTFGLNIMQVPSNVETIKAPTATAIDALTGVEGENYILVK